MEGDFNRTEASTTVIESTVTYVNGDVNDLSSMDGLVCNGDVTEVKECITTTMSDMPVESNVVETTVVSSQPIETKTSTDSKEGDGVSTKSAVTKKETSKTTKNSAKPSKSTVNSKTTSTSSKVVASKAGKPASKPTANDSTKKPSSASSLSQSSLAGKKSTSITKTVTKTTETKGGRVGSAKTTTTTTTTVLKNAGEGSKKLSKPSSAGSAPSDSKQVKSTTQKSDASASKPKDTDTSKPAKDAKTQKPSSASSTRSTSSATRKTVTDGPPAKKEAAKKESTKPPTKPDAKKDTKPASESATKIAPKASASQPRPTSTKKPGSAVGVKDKKTTTGPLNTKSAAPSSSASATKTKPSTPTSKTTETKTKPTSAGKPKVQDEKTKSAAPPKSKDSSKEGPKAPKKATEKSDVKPTSTKAAAKSDVSAKKSAASTPKTPPAKDAKKPAKAAPTKAKPDSDPKTKKPSQKTAKDTADAVSKASKVVKEEKKSKVEVTPDSVSITTVTETVRVVESTSGHVNELPRGASTVSEDQPITIESIAPAESSPNSATLVDDSFANEVLAAAKQDFVVESIDSEVVFEKEEHPRDFDQKPSENVAQPESEGIATVGTISLDLEGLTSEDASSQVDFSRQSQFVSPISKETTVEESATQIIRETTTSYVITEMESKPSHVDEDKDKLEYKPDNDTERHSVFTPDAPLDSRLDGSTPDVEIHDKVSTSLSSLSATPEPASCSIWTPDVSDIDQMSDIARDSDEGRLDEQRLVEISQEPTRSEDEILREGAMAPTPPLSMEPDLPSIKDTATRQVNDIELSGPFGSPPTTDTSMKEVDNDMKLEEQLERLENDNKQFDAYPLYSSSENTDSGHNEPFISHEEHTFTEQAPVLADVKDIKQSGEFESDMTESGQSWDNATVGNVVQDSGAISVDYDNTVAVPSSANSEDKIGAYSTDLEYKSSSEDFNMNFDPKIMNQNIPTSVVTSMIETSEDHTSYDPKAVCSPAKSSDDASLPSVLYSEQVEKHQEFSPHSPAKEREESQLITSSYSGDESADKPHAAFDSPDYAYGSYEKSEGSLGYDTTDLGTKTLTDDIPSEKEQKELPDLLGGHTQLSSGSHTEIDTPSSSDTFFNVEHSSQSEVIHSYEEISMKDATKEASFDTEKGTIGQSYEVIGTESTQPVDTESHTLVKKDFESSGFEEIHTQTTSSKIEFQGGNTVETNTVIVANVEELAPTSTSWDVNDPSQNVVDENESDNVDAFGKKVTIHPDFIHVEKTSAYAPLASPDPESDDERSDSEDESRLSDEEIRVNINGVTGPGARTSTSEQETSDVEDQGQKVESTSATIGYAQTPEPLSQSDDYPVHTQSLDDSFNQHFSETVPEGVRQDSPNHESKSYVEEKMPPSDATFEGSSEKYGDWSGSGAPMQSASEDGSLEVEQQFQQVSNEANGYVVVDSTRDLLDRQCGNGAVPAAQPSDPSDVSVDDASKDVNVSSSLSSINISQGDPRTDSPFHLIEYDALDAGAKGKEVELESSIGAEADALGENSSACFGDNSASGQEQDVSLTGSANESPSMYQHYSYKETQENDGNIETVTREYVQTSTTHIFTEADGLPQEFRDHQLQGSPFSPPSNSEAWDGDGKVELPENAPRGQHTVEYSTTQYHHQEMSESVPVEGGTMIDCQGDLSYTMSWEEKHTHHVTTTHYAYDADDGDETY